MFQIQGLIKRVQGPASIDSMYESYSMFFIVIINIPKNSFFLLKCHVIENNKKKHNKQQEHKFNIK